jgi:adenylate cyclase
VAAGVSDFGSTSFGAHQPLVLLHSTALNDLFQKTGHRRLPRAMDAATLLLVLVMGVSATCARTKKALTFFWLLGSGIILAAGVAMIFQTNWLPPTIGVTVLWSLAFIAELFRRHSAELIAKLKLRMTMGYYFSPRVLKRVLDNPGCMEPQQVEITVLLTDLRNFTPLSEKLGTRGIFALLNKLFAAQIKAVMAEDGTLEHFIGDQFMCYWGAPDAQPDRTDRALRGALNLMKAMEALRATLDSEVRKLYGYGVGIHSGTAMIGNIGSLDRMDYGVMGDLINSTARIESLTKFYGIPFVITRETFNGLSNPPLHRLVDSVLPVGKASPLELLEIKHPYASSFFEQIAPEYKIAFDLYRNGNFPAAQKRFKEIFLSYEDVPSHQMAARCELLEKNPPKEWRGVYQFRTK